MPVTTFLGRLQLAVLFSLDTIDNWADDNFLLILLFAITTMWNKIFGTYNALDQRGIPKDADNGASSSEGTKIEINKITNVYLLKYGED